MIRLKTPLQLGAAFYAPQSIWDEAQNIQLRTEYMQY